MEKMATRYEDVALLKCATTGDSEIVGVHEFTPRVSLVLDVFPGTKNYRRMTLGYDERSETYSAEIYGRLFTSRGPKMRGRSVR